MTTHRVERSTVIRKLTMTCWVFRDTLLPILWRNTEGCVVHRPHEVPIAGASDKTYGLYPQCLYLLSNPMIAAYVQWVFSHLRLNTTHHSQLCRVLSVDLSFKGAPKDLMTKFVDVLVRLPNLRTLELLSVSHRVPVTRGLKRTCAKFPTIREMIVCSVYPDFIKSCPNLESLTFIYGFSEECDVLSSYGAGLKRVGGVSISSGLEVDSEFPKIVFPAQAITQRAWVNRCSAELPETSGDLTLQW